MRTSRRSFHRDMSIAHHRSKTYLLLSAVLAFFVSAMRASGEDMPDLNRDIRPLFRDHCVKCHGPLRQDAKLNLSVPVGIARGGEGGAVIVPGQPKDSRLWQLVEQDEMPKGTPLSADEKDVLKRWIAAGAPGLPRPGDAIAADETHWAFRKLSRPAAAVVNQPGQI